MASTRGMPGSYLDKDTDYPEILRGFCLSLQANSGTASLLTPRSLSLSSCCPLPMHDSLSICHSIVHMYCTYVQHICTVHMYCTYSSYWQRVT